MVAVWLSAFQRRLPRVSGFSSQMRTICVVICHSPISRRCCHFLVQRSTWGPFTARRGSDGDATAVDPGPAVATHTLMNAPIARTGADATFIWVSAIVSEVEGKIFKIM